MENRLSGFARDKIVAREAITYGGRAQWPFAWVGSALLLGGALIGVMVVLRVILD